MVKVQRPGCRALIDLDLELMARAARTLAGRPWRRDFDPGTFVAEFDRALRSELDLTSEARTLDAFGEFFADDDGVEIPRVSWDQTTSRVLTASHLDGIPLSRPDEIRAAGGDIPRVVRRGVEALCRLPDPARAGRRRGRDRRPARDDDLAFRAHSRAHVDAVRAWAQEARHPLLYDDRYPFATAPGYYAVSCEDPDRIKLEVVAPNER